MKTIRTLIAALSIICIYHAAKAAPEEASKKISAKNAVSGFMNAFTEGRLKGFAQMLDENVKFTITRGNKIITYGKTAILKDLERTTNVHQNCETDYTLVKSLPNQVIFRIDMKYENFIRENFVTLVESNDGWRITHIASSYRK